MSTFNKSFLILALGLITVIGATGVAEARLGGGGYGPGFGQGAGPGSGNDAARAISPEALQIWQSACDKLAPLVLELRAKHKEFTAKVYSGADSKITDALRQDILRLQAQVTEARLTLQQQLAAAGVSLREARGMKGGGMGRGMMRGSCPMRQ